MPRKKKILTNKTTEDIVKKLFPKKVIEKAMEIAHEKDKLKIKKLSK